MEKTEELAIVTVHKAVQIRNLWLVSKTIRLSHPYVCGHDDLKCVLNNSFRDLVVLGMRDQEIRKRVLSRNTSSDLITLAKFANYIAAEEAGRSESSDIHTVFGRIRKRLEF
eukprot:GFUD01041338.1.p2 GENE.GFUD01041338.1~~GFUD01041338.1.p2  ORF type:complete len:112 (+),score=14.65 GFUD01041338.1:258-593(+)